MCLPVKTTEKNVDFSFLLLRSVVELVLMDQLVCVVFHVIVSVAVACLIEGNFYFILFIVVFSIFRPVQAQPAVAVVRY